LSPLRNGKTKEFPDVLDEVEKCPEAFLMGRVLRIIFHTEGTPPLAEISSFKGRIMRGNFLEKSFLHLGEMVKDPDPDWQALNADTDTEKLCQFGRIRIKQTLLSSIVFMFWLTCLQQILKRRHLYRLPSRYAGICIS
jgi:hypothetical protein